MTREEMILLFKKIQLEYKKVFLRRIYYKDLARKAKILPHELSRYLNYGKVTEKAQQRYAQQIERALIEYLNELKMEASHAKGKGEE